MEPIRNFVDTMFMHLPRSQEIMKLKEDVLVTMEEKYAELKSMGKSENEAIGTVISEFGNIDELVQELGVSQQGEERSTTTRPVLSDEEVDQYLALKKKAGFQIGLGVAMLLSGVAFFLFFNTVLSSGVWFGLMVLFALTVPAIGMFVYNGIKLNQLQYLANGFTLTYSTRERIAYRKQQFSSSFTLAIVLGVCLCVFSPVLLFLTMSLSEEYAVLGVSAMLLAIAAAVFMFVYSGNIKDSYSFLLKEGNHKPETKEERIIGAIASIVWPLATAVFLVAGFVFQLWHIAWVIFPVTGVLFGMISGIYKLVKPEK